MPEAFSPFHHSLEESNEMATNFEKAVKDMNVSDQELVAYVNAFFQSYRNTVEEFFPQIASFLPLYASNPSHTTIVRLGPNGVIVGHRHADAPCVEVKRFEELDPPLSSPNVLDIIDRLRFETCWFDFSPRHYSGDEANAHAVRNVLSGVMEFFWRSVPDGQAFQRICQNLLEAQGVRFQSAEQHQNGTSVRLDLLGTVLLREPAEFRRFESWGFEFKHYSDGRYSASYLREIEAAFSTQPHPDILCLVTSDDLTSIGRHVAAENSRIRVWDRSILDVLANRHPEVIRNYFEEYPKAVEELTRRFAAQKSGTLAAKSKGFADRLQMCPTGQTTFSEYEAIGIEVFSYLFAEELGEAQPQSRTLDGKQRRDVLFRNNRKSRFFDRLFHRFGADSIIVDFKNYGDEIDSAVVSDVDKYANKALGRFILVVSRKGPASSIEATQLRTFRDSNTVVLVIGDSDLLEMCNRKDRGQIPEDVLEDKLDELLRKY